MVALVRTGARVSLGFKSMGTWLLAHSVAVALMRFATNRCSSGSTVRSFVATMYELGFDLQATPSSVCVNRSAAVAKSVARTTFFSCRAGVARKASATFEVLWLFCVVLFFVAMIAAVRLRKRRV